MKFLPALLIVGISLTACHKKDATPTIDFGPNGGITARDNTGYLQGSADPTDWTLDETWNQQEQNLFQSLNFDLNDTQPSSPLSILLYPNPVADKPIFRVQQPGNATQLAWILVDRKYKAVRELAKGLPVKSAVPNTYAFDFSALKQGETYRMYYVFYTGTTLIGKGHGDIKIGL